MYEYVHTLTHTHIRHETCLFWNLDKYYNKDKLAKH